MILLRSPRKLLRGLLDVLILYSESEEVFMQSVYFKFLGVTSLRLCKLFANMFSKIDALLPLNYLSADTWKQKEI